MKEPMTWDQAMPFVTKIAEDSAKRWHDDIVNNISASLDSANSICESPIEVIFYMAWELRLMEFRFFGSPHGGKAAFYSHAIDRFPKDRAENVFGPTPKLDWPVGLGQIDLVYPQFSISPYRADFALRHFVRDNAADGDGAPPIVDASGIVIVECDGHDYHERTADQATRDKRRDRSLVSDGYSVFRFTGRELHADPGACAEEVNDMLDQLVSKAYLARRPKHQPA